MGTTVGNDLRISLSRVLWKQQEILHLFPKCFRRRRTCNEEEIASPLLHTEGEPD